MAKGASDDNEKQKRVALSNKKDKIIPKEQDVLVGFRLLFIFSIISY